jgi:hypothetical protein
MIGSPPIMANSARSTSALSTGWMVATMRCSASRINPMPIPARPRSHVRVLPPRLKAISPPRMNTGAATAPLNVSTCTISVLPTLAPSVTASAGANVMNPAAMKVVDTSAVAVLLWSRAVMPAPARSAFQRLSSPMASIRRSWPPKARTMPVWTMRSPHSSNATNPAICIKINVADMSRPSESAAAPESALFRCSRASLCCSPPVTTELSSGIIRLVDAPCRQMAYDRWRAGANGPQPATAGWAQTARLRLRR